MQYRHTIDESIGDTPLPVVTVSPKFQVVVPKEVREKLGIRPGQKLDVLVHEGRIEMLPRRPMRELRGCLRGIDTNVPRDADRP